MELRSWRSPAVLTLVVSLGSVVALAAGRPDRPDSKDVSTIRTPGVVRPGPASLASAIMRSTAILGVAWTADYEPIKQARLRLRNVETGRVQATAVANDLGQFAFDNVPGGSYVVELLNAIGHVEVIGHMFTIATGETVATFVRAGTKVPWFSGFFNSTVSSVQTTAVSEGVTALAPVARAVSPNQ